MKRILLMLVTVMMMLSVTVFTSIKAEENAPVPEIQLGTSALQKHAVIWFGSNADGEAMASGWQVRRLEEDGSILMLSDYVIHWAKYNADNDKGYTWLGSDAQVWCQELYDNWPFALEKTMILTTTVEESGTFEETQPSSIENQYFYFLSKREVVNGGLFDSPADREAFDVSDGRSARWWTRSGSVSYRDFVAWVNDDAYEFSVTNYWIGNGAGYRPAFHFDPSTILFVSSAVGSKADSSALSPIGANEDNNWKLTILDSSREFEADDSELTAQLGDTIRIPYTKAQTGDGEYVSVIVVKNNRDAEEVIGYASIAVEDAEGTAEFTVPDDMEIGEYVLKVFNEYKSGDKLTDYASAFTEVSLKVTHVHEWGEPEYKWSDDNSSVTATRVCTLDSEHTETETVDTTSEIIEEPDCENPGKTVYTAKFENEAFGTKTKEVAEPAALDHELSLVEYKEPTEDEPGNIAYYVCSRCGKFFEDENGENEIVDHDSVIIPALDHDLTFVPYKAPTTEEEGNIAYYVCNRCGKFFEDEDGEVEIVDHDSVIIPKLNPVPDTGNNNVMLELAVMMMAVSAAGGALYVSAERQRREEE